MRLCPELSRRLATGALLGALCALAPTLVSAQPDGRTSVPAPAPSPDPLFGLEFELRSLGHRAETWEDMRYERFERILGKVVGEIGGDPSKIRKVEWVVEAPSGPRTLVRAEYTDRRGGTWRVEPEYVDTRAPTGYELVTPPLQDPSKIERIVRAVRSVAGEGIKSSVHVHVDGRGLVGPRGDATALVNLINLHETYEPLLRRLFNPNRGAGLYNWDARTGVEGAYMNRFNRPLYADHPDLLRELASLPEGERTTARLEELFRARTEAEARAHGIGELNAKSWRQMWKYRSLNLVNALGINEVLPNSTGTVEFRMNDLSLENPTAHQRQVEFYRALVTRARSLAAEGRVAPAPNHPAVPRGENPAEFLTSVDPAKAANDARAMLKEMGLDPAPYEAMIRANLRPPPVLSESAFRRRIAELSANGASAGLSGVLPLAEGEAGLRAALEALRAPSTGPRPKLEVRVAVPAEAMDVALSTARRLAEGANLSTHLGRMAHTGVNRAAPDVPTVEVSREGNAVKLSIDPRNQSVQTVEELARVLAEGVRTAVSTGRAGPRGGGRPSASGTLAERASAYASEAEGRTLSPELRSALDAIERTGGRDVLLPLLNWGERALPNATLRDLRFRSEAYLRAAIAAADALPTTGEAEAVRSVRSALRAWARETHLPRLLQRSLLPSGIERAVNEVAEAERAKLDPYRDYRRADGTLEWKRMTRDRALREAGGAAHFALALFLKELAVVAKTGDRARIEEFFDGLATTDFYVHYGLFVVGARAGEVAYSRYLQRFIKPRFVSGILKTNLVLATGLALPELVSGQFNGRAFAITLGSLGLSTGAVRAGVAGIKWVTDLKSARKAGTLGTLGRASRLARFGGWIYSAAELAVILYVAEDLETRVHAALDLKAARESLAEESRKLFALAGDPTLTPERLREASEDYHAAWSDYRNFLYAPLQDDEALFASRMEKAARRAKLAADERRAALANVAKHPALSRSIVRRYGSIEAYADSLAADEERALSEDLETYANAYERSRTEHLAEIYDSHRRGTALLSGVANREWLLTGARTAAGGDPTEGGLSVFSRLGRWNARRSLDESLGNVSRNRLEAYGDEAELLGALADVFKTRGRADLAAVVGETRSLTLRTRDVDERLAHGDGIAALGGPEASTSGAAEAVESVGD